MKNSRGLIITLIIIVIILAIALTGAIVYIMMQKGNDSNNNNAVNNSSVHNSDEDYDTNEIENVANNNVSNNMETNSEENVITGDNEIVGDDIPTIEDDMEKLKFNSQFTPYLGQITGTQLNNLLLAIQTSNNVNSEHKIGLTSNNLQNLNGLLAENLYVITLSYDTQGYINSVNIDLKI